MQNFILTFAIDTVLCYSFRVRLLNHTVLVCMLYIFTEFQDLRIDLRVSKEGEGDRSSPILVKIETGQSVNPSISLSIC